MSGYCSKCGHEGPGLYCRRCGSFYDDALNPNVEYLCPKCQHIWKEAANPGHCPKCDTPAFWFDYPDYGKKEATKSKFTPFQERVQWVVVYIMILVYGLFNYLFPWVIRQWTDRVVREAVQRGKERDKERDKELKKMFWKEADRMGWEVTTGD